MRIPNLPKPKCKSGYKYREYKRALIHYQPNSLTDRNLTKNTMMPSQCLS